MAYDPHFAARIREALAGKTIVEKKMFGGVGFMLNGNMVCGIYRDDLMLHVAIGDTDKLLQRKGAKPFEMRGKAMKGWLLIGPESIRTTPALQQWVNVALAYAESLPVKAAKQAKQAKPTRSRA
jgi:TfoX/Sxy family transcriptional regulator of competence genes